MVFLPHGKKIHHRDTEKEEKTKNIRGRREENRFLCSFNFLPLLLFLCVSTPSGALKSVWLVLLALL